MGNDDQSTKDTGRGVYGISVAAELSGTGPQTLRMYERKGLIDPARTDGGTRRYSDDDLARVRRVTDLVDQGVNLSGVKKILELEDDHAELQARTDRAEADNARLRSDNDSLRKDRDRAEPDRSAPDHR